MVRINLIHPRFLFDKHLVAEYNEILKLIGYIKKYPNTKGIPENYTLGEGHIKFFVNKIRYLQKRFSLLAREMLMRGYKPNLHKQIKFVEMMNDTRYLRLFNDWKPTKKDVELIKLRLIEKVKEKPDSYKYRGEKMELEKMIEMIEKAHI